jgi:hypothetical protein
MKRWILGLCSIALVACGEGDSLDGSGTTFSEEWVSGEVAPGSASTETPGSEAQPYDGDADEIYDDNETHEAFIFGEANVTPDVSFEGTSEFWVVYYPDEGEEQILCEARWTLSAVQSMPTCDGCSFAFLVRYSEISILTDVASACEVGGFTAADYENEEFIFAYRDNQILESIDGEWVAAGEASYTASNSTFEYYIEGSY